MKNVIVGIALLAASSANATEYFVEFDIAGLFTINNYTEIELEVELTGQYMTANGALNTLDGLSSPATGTCFNSASGGVYCNLQVDQTSVTLSVGKTFAGTISVKDAAGITTATSSVSLYDIYPVTP